MRYFNLEDYLQTLNDEGNSYWSGLNARIFINSFYVSEAIQFEYQVMETVVPTFHYSEYVARRLLAGVRYVTGRFSVNVTDFKYVHYLIKALNGNPGATEGITSPVPSESPTIAVPVSGSTSFTSAVDLFNYTKTYSKNQITVPKGPVSISAERPLFQFPANVNITLALGNFEIENPKVLKPLDDQEDYIISNALFDSTAAPIRTAHAFTGVTITGRSQIVADDGKSLIETFEFMATDTKIL